MIDSALLHIIFIEYILLLITSVVCVVLLFTLEMRMRNREKKSQFLSSMLVQMVTKRIDVFYYYVPKSYIKASLLIPEMLKIDAVINDPFWSYLKQEILCNYLKKELHLRLHSTFWINIHTALLGVSLAPMEEFKQPILNALAKTKGLINLSATKCALLYELPVTIKASISKLSKESVRTQFLYRDLLLYSNLETFKQILKHFRETENFEEKLACLKVLSFKAGFLTFEDLIPFVNHESLEARWWGLRAIENTPCDQGIAALTKALQDSEWVIRALSAYILGSLYATKCSDTLKQSLSDSHYFVRFVTAYSLSCFGNIGQEILAKEIKNPDKAIQEVCEVVQSFPHATLHKSLQRIFPINQDPLIILGAFL